jgi:butyryl-CoA dehydrogenase
MNKYTDSIFIVTGAASGIGRELAIQSALLGAAVIAVDLNSEGLQETRKTSENIQTAVLDVGNKEEILRFADNVLPQLDNRKLILINNAGVALMSGNFHDTRLEDMEWLMNINFWGAVRMTKAFFPYFIKQDRGHIVNVSSVFGLGGFVQQSAYSSSKFAVRGFTETLRMELIGTGVKTHSVHPGGIDTSIVKNARISDQFAGQQGQAIKEFANAAITTPSEAARVILDGISNNRERILIGKDARMIDKVVRLFPSKYSAILKKQIEKKFTDPYRKG